MKPSTLIKSILIVALAGIGLLSGVGAQAAPRTATDLGEFRDLYEKYDVDTSTTTRLIDEILNGNLPDSLAGGQIAQRQTRMESGSVTTIETYKDGSISVSTIGPKLTANGSLRIPRAIAGCADYSSGGYVSKKNCTVSLSNGLITMSFLADYSYWGTGSAISNARNAQVKAHYGSATQAKLNRTSATGSGSGPAVVTSHSRFTSWAGTSSEDLYLSLRVYTRSATSTNY